MGEKKRKPSALKRSAGVVLAMMIALSYFSPMQETLRSLPDRIALTQGRSAP
jgi:hypothetical protein